ncbi:MAG: hypothetical protein KME19_18840 [Microcoleus vaginatus WJT46-NPBG5]|nr:hypothetical protein [Microcoleus vaginatus WJT46-NPBG5]
MQHKSKMTAALNLYVLADLSCLKTGHWAWGIGHGVRLRQPKGMGMGHGA